MNDRSATASAPRPRSRMNAMKETPVMDTAALKNANARSDRGCVATGPFTL